MMAGIRSKNTKPELIIRSGLHKLGFRYHVNYLKLPGKPDLVFPRYQAVIFIHGCFWHKHGCHLFRWPTTRADFWKVKLTGNVERDRRATEALLSSGWRVLVVWECALKGKTRLPIGEVIERCGVWIRSDDKYNEIQGEELGNSD